VGLPDAAWRTSPGRRPGGCVEVAFVDDGVAVRDSKDQNRPVLKFPPVEWEALVGGVRLGEFDLSLGQYGRCAGWPAAVQRNSRFGRFLSCCPDRPDVVFSSAWRACISPRAGITSRPADQGLERYGLILELRTCRLGCEPRNEGSYTWACSVLGVGTERAAVTAVASR
jgi:Domain of unknown function (DUF397)